MRTAFTLMMVGVMMLVVELAGAGIVHSITNTH